ncbi:DUF1501 domain-containing protein [Photobacterium kishitanii]|uniref:DUF1501 domain-containing protein n=1 Tax=Photobacterium kishitanii TaxID=318456 RepID=UPI0005D30901|nr:DUF1501 domain-containing protein [Photobacterium kishitanii]KJG10991.1 hypothetical protein UB40_06680 [Photobacterium kishitanii]PSV08359.1 DUF1501 domain-containing protein [Photobacterium kishitanii]PSV74014.1 DUF1501 domain-containing protein [Photobacterium kishitanii]
MTLKLSRRRFLQSTAALSATTLSAPALALTDKNLQPNNHKALVILFLYGGNDAYNMIVPTTDSTSYAAYHAARPKLCLKDTEITPLAVATDNQVPLGIHHKMATLAPLFARGEATALINSGQLLAPTTASAIATNQVEVPQFLMAHNMQQNMWQTGASEYNNPLGWAGRMMDMFTSSSDLSPLIALNSDKRLLRSQTLGQTVVSAQGAGKYAEWDDNTKIDQYFAHFTVRNYDNIYSRHFSKVMQQSVSDNEALKQVLATHPPTAVYPTTDLGGQLEMVARLINARQTLAHQRQVFFVGIGGFDTHVNQKLQHDELYTEISDALVAFNADMHAQDVHQQVTTITMSDFGRRIQANESGTDHGWGGHQLVMGGALQGGQAYGLWPDLTAGSEDDFNHGRIIPSMAADQVNASLCRWFGLNDQQVLTLFPNLAQFNAPYIPFI